MTRQRANLLVDELQRPNSRLAGTRRCEIYAAADRGSFEYRVDAEYLRLSGTQLEDAIALGRRHEAAIAITDGVVTFS